MTNIPPNDLGARLQTHTSELQELTRRRLPAPKDDYYKVTSAFGSITGTVTGTRTWGFPVSFIEEPLLSFGFVGTAPFAIFGNVWVDSWVMNGELFIGAVMGLYVSAFGCNGKMTWHLEGRAI